MRRDAKNNDTNDVEMAAFVIPEEAVRFRFFLPRIHGFGLEITLIFVTTYVILFLNLRMTCVMTCVKNDHTKKKEHYIIICHPTYLC
jgi:hypothetical protein